MNWWFIIGVAAILELVTYILRTITGLHSRNVQNKLKLPIRVHHMYVGMIIAIIGLLYTEPVMASAGLVGLSAWIPASFNIYDVGMAIVMSDVIHHFIVMPLAHEDMDFP